MKKVLKVVGIVLVVLLIGVVLAKDVLIKKAAQIVLASKTGLRLEADRFQVGLLSTKVNIEGLKIYNPEGYADPLMLDLPRLLVDYHLRDIIGGTLHLNAVEFDLKEVIVVKRADGTSNIDGVMRLAQTPAGDKAKAPKLQIDRMTIRVGRFVTISYDARGKASPKELKLNIDETFENVTDPNAITARLAKYINTILMQTMKELGLKDVNNLVGGTISSVGEVGTGAVKSVTGIGKEAVGQATTVIGDAADGLRNVLKSPFGGGQGE